MKILNLFSGIGGNRTLWENKHEITAVEHNQPIALIYHKRFPNDKVVIGDAYEYLVNNFKKFDFIWASPPCYTHTRVIAFPSCKKKLPDLKLYSIIIFLKRFFSGFWVVENVVPHYKSLIKPAAIIDRHYVWSNFYIKAKMFKEQRSGNVKDLKLSILCELLQIDYEIIKDFAPKGLHNRHTRRGILRNCVLPDVGKYILESIMSKKQRTLFECVEDFL